MPATAVSTVLQKRGPAAMAAVKEHAGEAAELLKALASEQRLLVLCCLLEGPRSVGEINERVLLSQSALSQHLAVLREAGLVTTERQSQTIRYALAPGPTVRIMEVLYSEFCTPPARSPRRTRRSR
jgi:ArsR family transcriptional regulator, virulence genes transcriptional regulator